MTSSSGNNGDFAQPLANLIQQQTVNVSTSGIGLKDIANNSTKVDAETRSKLNFIGTNAITDDGIGDQVTVTLCDRGTSFPASPNDQDEYAYLADATNGVVWRFKYNSGSSSSYKWEFVGGPCLYAEVLTAETTTSTSFTNLATAGPSIIVPLAGDYMIEWGFLGVSAVAGLSTLFCGPNIGGTAPTDPTDTIDITTSGASTSITGSRQRIYTALSAATTVKLQYKTDGANDTFRCRWARITPRRVSA